MQIVIQTLRLAARAHCLGICALALAWPFPLLGAPGDDLVLPRAEDSMSVESQPASIFPHWVHRVRYRCDACHDRLFRMELGATEINMKLMKEGGSCGTCHDGKRAFGVGFDTCQRCHVPPQ